MLKLFVYLMVIVLSISCNSNNADNKTPQQNNASIPKSISDSLYQTVMQGHDSAMIKTGEVIRYQQVLKKQRDSLTMLKGNHKNRLTGINAVLDSLQNAQDLMNKWMNAFDPEKAGATEAEKQLYFQKEKEKVETVKSLILHSIERAKEITGH
ncbi:MAG: hypothetical protein QM802_14480 [Agriterribacter sp.]